MLYQYGDKIKVITGFYRGQEGTVIHIKYNKEEWWIFRYTLYTKIEYLIDFNNNHCRWINEEHLKLQAL